jgi:cytochrome c
MILAAGAARSFAWLGVEDLMIRPLKIALILVTALVWLPLNALAEGEATPEEVIAKVKEAAAYLAKEGESGLQTFRSMDSPFVWKDSYVFVYNCEAGLGDVAHPVPATKPSKISENKDATGKVIGPEFCKAAERPGGGWLEYPWWKPVRTEGAKEFGYPKDISRKVTYMLKVKGQPYEVGAGVYSDTLSVDDLNAQLKQ